MEEVIRWWQTPDPPLHPTKGTDAYWESGKKWAEMLGGYVPSGKVLDFGCGDGRVAKHLVEAGYSVACCDTSDLQLHRCAENLNTGAAQFYFGLDEVDKRKKFDAILALAVLIHYPPDEGELLLLELSRFLSKKGKMLVNVEVDEHDEDGGPFGVAVWSTKRWQRVLEAADLKVAAIPDFAIYVLEKA